MTILNKKIILSLMGVDGSGKTTLAKELNKILIKSRYLHLKPYILFKDKRTTIKNPHSNKKSSFIFSLTRLLSWLISYKIFFFKNKNFNFLILDRYAHDILIDPLRYKHNLPNILTKFLLSLFPAPDLWIFLNPSLKIILSRKKELPIYELRRQIKKYKIFFSKSKNVLRLNTNIEKKKLIKKIEKKINNLLKKNATKKILN